MKAFSTRFEKNSISWVDFGEPDENEGTDVNGTAFIRAPNDYFWSSGLDAIQIGESDNYGFKIDG